MESRLFDLTGKMALVTGAGRGIGLALAEGLAEQGADVALVARTGGCAALCKKDSPPLLASVKRQTRLAPAKGRTVTFVCLPAIFVRK